MYFPNGDNHKSMIKIQVALWLRYDFAIGELL